MKVPQTKAFLDKILTATAMDSDVVDPLAVWAAFKLLLYQRVDDCDDEGPVSFLVDWGLLDSEGHIQIYLYFVRMFSFVSDNEYSHTVETRCDLMCQAWPGLSELTDEGAPSDCRSLERSIFDIERRVTFRRLIHWPGPWTLEVYTQQQ